MVGFVTDHLRMSQKGITMLCSIVVVVVVVVVVAVVVDGMN